MTDMCMRFAALERYATGRASRGERDAVESHAAGCDQCRLALAATGLALGRGSVAEEALVAWAAEARPVPVLLAELGIGSIRRSTRAPVPIAAKRPSRWGGRALRGAVGGVAAALAASFAIIAFQLPGAEAPLLPSRMLEGRPGALTNFVPFASERGGTARAWETYEAEFSEALGRDGKVAVLLARGASGDWQRAADLIADVKPTAITENDRGVLLLAQGMAEAAHAAFERALQLDQSQHSAAFNRALALDAMGRFSEAYEAWGAYLETAGDDLPGWREEAQRRMAARAD